MPYFGPAETNLVFVYDGNSKFDDNGLINMYMHSCAAPMQLENERVTAIFESSRGKLE